MQVISIVKLGGGHHARKDDHRGITAGSDHHVGRNAPTGLGAIHENPFDVRKSPETSRSRAGLNCGL
jgi:hypothetical protein